MESPVIEPTWDDLRVLLAVHRHQSFKRAGDALGLSTSTTARRIEALEAAMGRALVVRTSRGTVVDPGALRLVDLAESLELGLRAARRHDEALRGSVRLSAGDGFASALVPVLAELRRRTPETAIELVSEARLVDVARREADLAIRTSRTPSAVVIERRLGSVRFGLYASKAFVERRLGGATTLAPREFERLEFIGALGPQAQAPQMKWLHALGAQRFGFRANTDALVLEAARQSQGVAVLASLVGDADPSLQRLEANLPGPAMPVWLAFHRALRDVPRVRAVAQAVEAAFRAWL